MLRILAVRLIRPLSLAASVGVTDKSVKAVIRLEGCGLDSPNFSLDMVYTEPLNASEQVGMLLSFVIFEIAEPKVQPMVLRLGCCTVTERCQLDILP